MSVSDRYRTCSCCNKNAMIMYQDILCGACGVKLAIKGSTDPRNPQFYYYIDSVNEIIDDLAAKAELDVLIEQWKDVIGNLIIVKGYTPPGEPELYLMMSHGLVNI